MTDMPEQSDHDISEIHRVWELPPDEPYFHGDPDDPADPPLDEDGGEDET